MNGLSCILRGPFLAIGTTFCNADFLEILIASFVFCSEKSRLDVIPVHKFLANGRTFLYMEFLWKWIPRGCLK